MNSNWYLSAAHNLRTLNVAYWWSRMDGAQRLTPKEMGELRKFLGEVRRLTNEAATCLEDAAKTVPFATSTTGHGLGAVNTAISTWPWPIPQPMAEEKR